MWMRMLVMLFGFYVVRDKNDNIKSIEKISEKRCLEENRTIIIYRG